MSTAAMILEVATRTALTILILFATAPAYAQIVKYTDEQGQTHYVGAPDQVPTKYRAQSVDLKDEAPKQTTILPSTLPSTRSTIAGEWSESGADAYGLYQDAGTGEGFRWVKSYLTLAECSAAAKTEWLTSKHPSGCRAFYSAATEPQAPQSRGIQPGEKQGDYRKRIKAGEVVTDRKRLEWDRQQTMIENCLRMASRFRGSVANCKP
jgi:hypothetical protein